VRVGAMASYPQQQRREEVEVDLLEFELTKRRVLLGLAVLLCLSAVASTIICALHGWGWPAAGSGVGVAVLGGLTVRGASPTGGATNPALQSSSASAPMPAPGSGDASAPAIDQGRPLS
jgi:hypothetical protein